MTSLHTCGDLNHFWARKNGQTRSVVMSMFQSPTRGKKQHREQAFTSMSASLSLPRLVRFPDVSVSADDAGAAAAAAAAERSLLPPQRLDMALAATTEPPSRSTSDDDEEGGRGEPLLSERKPVLTIAPGEEARSPKRRRRRGGAPVTSVTGGSAAETAAAQGRLVKFTILDEWLESFAGERDAWHSMALAAELHMARAEIFSAGLGHPNELVTAVAFTVLERMGSLFGRFAPVVSRLLVALRAAVYVNAPAFVSPAISKRLHAAIHKNEKEEVCAGTVVCGALERVVCVCVCAGV